MSKDEAFVKDGTHSKLTFASLQTSIAKRTPPIPVAKTILQIPGLALTAATFRALEPTPTVSIAETVEKAPELNPPQGQLMLLQNLVLNHVAMESGTKVEGKNVITLLVKMYAMKVILAIVASVSRILHLLQHRGKRHGGSV